MENEKIYSSVPNSLYSLFGGGLTDSFSPPAWECNFESFSLKGEIDKMRSHFIDRGKIIKLN